MESMVRPTLGSLPHFLDISSAEYSEVPSSRQPQTTKSRPRRWELSQTFAEKFGVTGNFLYENRRVDVTDKLRRLATQGGGYHPHHRKIQSTAATAREAAHPSLQAESPQSRAQYTRNKLL